MYMIEEVAKDLNRRSIQRAEQARQLRQVRALARATRRAQRAERRMLDARKAAARLRIDLGS